MPQVERHDFTTTQAWLALRAEDITSTDVAALFNLSPYTTPFELWHRKAHKIIIELEPNERMEWGNALQPAIANEIARRSGWKIRHMTEYLRIPDLRMAASFDYEITISPTEIGILEIKNVDALVFKQWLNEDGEIEAPPHIELQVQTQLAVSGRPFAYLGVLVGGNELVLIKRVPDPNIISKIKARVVAFWASVRAGQEPEPDFSVDAAFITSLHGYAEPGKMIDVKGNDDLLDLAVAYKTLGETINAAKTKREELKARMLQVIGDAEKARGDGYLISATSVGPTLVEAFEKKGYRDFRITWKKPKEPGTNGA